MIVPTSLAEAVMQGWQEYHDQLIATVKPLTAEQLALSAQADLRTVGKITAHLIRARVSWFGQILGEGDAEIITMAHWDDPSAPLLSADDLVHGLTATWTMLSTAIARWTPADLAAHIVLREPAETWTVSRAWVIWHVLEHDLHHGGELAYTLGMHGVAVHVPPAPPEG